MILAIDIGTSKLKGGVFNEHGELLALAQRPLSLRLHHKPDTGQPVLAGTKPVTTGFEIEAAQWLTALKGVCHELDLVRFASLTSLVVSGNGPTLLPLDNDGRPLYPAITWLDTRGQEETACSLKLKGITGKQSSFFLAKAFWLKLYQPALYAQTRYFIPCPEYLNYYLCGEARTILPTPAFGAYYWTNETLAALDLAPEKFPPFIRPGEIVGTLRELAAADLGIRIEPGQKKPTIVAGGPDYLMALLGTGTIKPGLTCDRAGSSEGINHCASAPASDPLLLTTPHLIGGMYNVSGTISVSGKAIDWFRETSGYGQVSYEHFFQEVTTVAPGARKLLFLPYLAGERAPLWDPHAKGAFIGLALHHTRREMGRAVIESLGYAIRYIIDRLAASGLYVKELRLAGQQANNRLFNQLKADITGLPLLIPVSTEAELAGDACLGLVANGYYSDIGTAVTQCIKIKTTIEPDTQAQNLYADMAVLYTDAYLSIKHIFDRLSKIE